MGTKAKSTTMLVALVVIWGATFPFEKMALTDVSPFALNFYRFIIADVLILLLFFQKVKKDLGPVFKSAMLLGMFLSAGYVLQTVGLKYTTPAKSGFITSLSIVMIPFLSVFVERTKLTLLNFLTLMTATIGIYFSEMSGNIFTFNAGDLLTVGCAVAFALHVVFTTKITKKLEGRHIALSFLQMGVVALVNLPFYLLNFGGNKWQFRDVWLVGFIALFASFFALLIQMKHQKNVGTIPSAFIYAGEPVAAAFFSYLIMGERYSPFQLLGFSLIVFSAVFTHITSDRAEQS